MCLCQLASADRPNLPLAKFPLRAIADILPEDKRTTTTI